MLYPIKNNNFLKKDCRKKQQSLFSFLQLHCNALTQLYNGPAQTYFTYSMLMESMLALNASVHPPPACCV